MFARCLKMSADKCLPAVFRRLQTVVSWMFDKIIMFKEKCLLDVYRQVLAGCLQTMIFWMFADLCLWDVWRQIIAGCLKTNVSWMFADQCLSLHDSLVCIEFRHIFLPNLLAMNFPWLTFAHLHCYISMLIPMFSFFSSFSSCLYIFSHSLFVQLFFQSFDSFFSKSFNNIVTLSEFKMFMKRQRGQIRVE